MKGSLTVSSIGHAALIAWAVVGLHGASSRDMISQQPLPIDIISMEEFTQITAGTRDGNEEAAPGTPEPVKETAAADRPTPEPRAREQSAAPEPAPPPPPRPEPEPVRTAAIPPEPVPEPAARPEPRPERAAEPAPAPTPVLAEAPLPRPRPETPRPRREPEPQQAEAPGPQPASPPAEPARRESQFDPDRIAALLNRVPDAGGAVVSDASGQSHGFGLPRGADERLSMGEIDALRRQIARCWSPPIGVVEAEHLLVRIAMELNPDGSLAAPPRVIGGSSDLVFNIAAEAAVRAVSRCEPYSLPAEKYHVWREILVNFDPREILGG